MARVKLSKACKIGPGDTTKPVMSPPCAETGLYVRTDNHPIIIGSQVEADHGLVGHVCVFLDVKKVHIFKETAGQGLN